MSGTVATTFVSGVLILIATIVGAFLQHVLQHRRTHSQYALEARSKVYGCLAAKVVPILNALVEHHTGDEGQTWRVKNIQQFSQRSKVGWAISGPKIGRKKVQDLFFEVEIAIGESLLYAGEDLTNHLLRLEDSIIRCRLNPGWSMSPETDDPLRLMDWLQEEILQIRALWESTLTLMREEIGVL